MTRRSPAATAHHRWSHAHARARGGRRRGDRRVVHERCVVARRVGALPARLRPRVRPKFPLRVRDWTRRRRTGPARHRVRQRAEPVLARLGMPASHATVDYVRDLRPFNALRAGAVPHALLMGPGSYYDNAGSETPFATLPSVRSRASRCPRNLRRADVPRASGHLHPLRRSERCRPGRPARPRLPRRGTALLHQPEGPRSGQRPDGAGLV